MFIKIAFKVNEAFSGTLWGEYVFFFDNHLFTLILCKHSTWSLNFSSTAKQFSIIFIHSFEDKGQQRAEFTFLFTSVNYLSRQLICSKNLRQSTIMKHRFLDNKKLIILNFSIFKMDANSQI